METRQLTTEDRAQLEALLMREPAYNVFHLSALREYDRVAPIGPAPDRGEQGGLPWAAGVLRAGELVGAVMASRGTGGVYHVPGDEEALQSLAGVVVQKGRAGTLSLMSGHDSQVGAILPLVSAAGAGPPDHCRFMLLQSAELQLSPTTLDFSPPRLATVGDIERLIDFYITGFYSLAHLPSRAAWRARLDEQIAFRTMYLVEDAGGRVISAAQSSAEGGGAAMLGGVATRSEYRGRGLSTRCVGVLCEHLFAHGCVTISLFYLEGNEPAARVYTRLGFKDAGRWLLVPLGLGASFAPLFTLRTR